MGQHDPFGFAGGPGRIDQSGYSVLTVCIDGLGHDAFVQSTLTNRPNFWNLPDRSSVPLSMFPGVGRHRSRVDDPTGTTMFPNLIDLSGGKSSVGEHRPSVQTGQCQKCGDEGPAILANDHDAIARAHAGFPKPSPRGSGC